MTDKGDLLIIFDTDNVYIVIKSNENMEVIYEQKNFNCCGYAK